MISQKLTLVQLRCKDILVENAYSLSVENVDFHMYKILKLSGCHSSGMESY